MEPNYSCILASMSKILKNEIDILIEKKELDMLDTIYQRILFIENIIKLSSQDNDRIDGTKGPEPGGFESSESNGTNGTGKDYIHPQVKKLMLLPQYEQRSKEWFEQRRNKLTSSDIDSVLGTNKYSSYDEVLFKKCGISKPFTGNNATRHGQKYEDEAIELFCKRYNKKVFSFGMLPHPTIDFIGGSPDDITSDGIVIEVKCPLTRKIVLGKIPEHYKSQIYMNMEICQLDRAVFIEYKPECITGNGKSEFNVVELRRDPKWIEQVYPYLEKFWNDVIYYRTNGIENHPKYEYYYKLANPEPKPSMMEHIDSNNHGYGSDSSVDSSK